jgi:hypothetical protein
VSVEILGPVIGVLWLIALILRIRQIVEQIQQEQREQPFGSKRWHWPAVAFLGFLVLAITLLRSAADSG